MADFDPYADDPFLAWIHSQAMTAPAVVDPFAAAAPAADPAAPPPVDVTVAAAPPPPPELTPIQPGLGIPAAAADAAAAQLPHPTLGFPTAPPASVPDAELGLPRIDAEQLDVNPIDAEQLDTSSPAFPPPSWQTDDEIEMPLEASSYANPLDIPDEAERKKALLDLSRTDPEKYVSLQLERQEEQEREQARLEHEAARKRAQADQQAFDEHQRFVEQARAETAAQAKEADAIAKTHVNTGRWFSSRSPLQHLAGFLGAVVGGLVMSQTGGRNIVLDMMDREIDRDIDAQKTDLQNRSNALTFKKNALGELIARTGDEYRAGQLFRAASYSAAIDEMHTQMQQFDPKGSAAFRYVQAINQMDAMRAQAVDAAATHRLDSLTKQADLANKQADYAAKIKKLGGAGTGGAGTAGKGTYTPERLRAEGFTAVPPDGWTGAFKDYKGWLEAQTKNKDLGEPERIAAKESAERLRQWTLPGVTELDSDGKPTPFVMNADPDTAKKLKAKYAATQQIVNLMDHALAIRSGWSTDVGKSDEWARLKTVWGAAVMQAKDAGALGAISESDRDLIAGWLGTDDPTKMRGVEAAVKQARTNFVDGIRSDMRYLGGLSPKAAGQFDIDNPYAKSGGNSKEQQAYKDLKESDKGAVNDPLPGAAWLIPGAKLVAKGVNALRSESTDIGQGDERKQIDAWAAEMQGTDPAAREKATGLLLGLMNSASPAVRVYAQQQFYKSLGNLHPAAHAAAGGGG